MEIYVNGEEVILKKYAPDCVFCGNANDIKQIKGKNVCAACLQEIAAQVKR